ncbi:MAG: hypothetical protein K2I08_03675 [Muribaculaceae bacterium]|nr:hypothetical protein [Muribaculaceae bacterium]MDE6522166.1 hypothetical protein [Muribaculaceae bacterium]
MAKKTATYAKYELHVEDNGKIVILDDGQPVQNAKGAIRTIAADVNFTLDPKWNTQSAGRKLVDFLNSTTTISVTSVKTDESASPASESTIVPKPVSKQKVMPEDKSAKHNTENELTEEEMNELLKQIAELRKTIESLESRVATLEDNQTSEATTKKGLTRTISKDYIYCPYRTSYAYLLYFVHQNDGKMGYLKPICTSDGNHTVGQTRKVADMFGYKYDSKTKREMLGFELVSKYGDGEWAFIGKNAVDANGVTYDFIETNLPYDPDYLKFATGQLKDAEGKPYLDLYTNNPLVVDPKEAPDEIAAKLLEFRNSLVRK